MSGENDKTPSISTVAGIGAGTGLLGLANSIPDSYPLAKHVAIYAAPTATVLVRWGWIFFAFWINAIATKKSADYSLRKMRTLRDEVLGDCHATEEHKKAMQEQCENLEKVAAGAIASNAKSIQDKFGNGGD